MDETYKSLRELKKEKNYFLAKRSDYCYWQTGKHCLQKLVFVTKEPEWKTFHFYFIVLPEILSSAPLPCSVTVKTYPLTVLGRKRGRSQIRNIRTAGFSHFLIY